MARGLTPRQPRDKALAALVKVLAGLDRPAAVIGGIAVIAWGFARLTADIDCAIAASTSDLKQLLARFKRGGFEARSADAIAFAEQNLVLLLRHRTTEIDIDVSLAHLDFEVEALSAAVRRPFGGVQIPVPRVTDLFIYKLIAGRPRDLQDVEELMALGLSYDRQRIERTLTSFDEALGTDAVRTWHMLERSL